jgi:membrane fusion protein, copper/silver efflux system
MKKVLSALLLVLVSLVLAYQAGRHRAPASSDASAGARHILYYVDPMHPSYKSDKPGIAPDCGMQLEPVYSDDAGAIAPAAVENGGLPPGIININLEQQQLIGIRTVEVSRNSGSNHLTAPARVVADETRTYRLTAGTDGLVLATFDHSAGSVVKKDEVLATFGSPDFLVAEQSFLQSWYRAPENRHEWSSPAEWKDQLLQFAASRLLAMGLSEGQLKELVTRQQPADSIHIISPVSGVILSRTVTAGQQVPKGGEFYRISDLNHVWIMAALPEDEAKGLHPGTEVKLTVPNQENSWRARVSSELPVFDPATRTLQVRLEAENPGLVLRPDMFVNVELEIQSPAALTVPIDALLDSGLAKRVYVDRGNGGFEPRQVKTGRYSGDRVEIVSGLEPGEHVVIAGTFLLDSESRLKSPQHHPVANQEHASNGVSSSKPEKPTKDPSCGMEVDPARAVAAGNTASYRGTTYYFCSRSCRDKFHQDPQKFLAAGDDDLGKVPTAGIKQGSR